MSTFRITQENITDILELHQDGKSNIEVGTAVGFSGVHIGRVLKCYKLHGEEVLRQNPSLSTPVERLGREINEIIEFLFCYRIPRELVSIIFLVPSSALNEAYYQRLRTGKRLATQIAKVPHTVNQEELDKLIRRYNKNKSPEDCRKEYMAQIRSQVCMEESASDDGYVTGFQISARKLPEGLKDFVPTGNKIEDTIAIFKMGGRPVDLTRILNTHQAEASRTITFLKIHGPDEYRRLPTLSEPGGYSWDCILAIVEFCLATGALPSQAARIFKTTDATLKRAIKVRQRTIAPDVRLNVAALLPGTNLIEAEKTVKMPFGESFSSLIKAYLAGRDPMPPYNRQVTTSSGTAAEAEAAAGAAEAAAAGKVTATSAADCAAADAEAAAGAAEGAEADSGASAEAAEETATGAPEGAEADSDAAAEACEETATSAAEGFEAGEENVTGAAEGSEAGEETATGAPEGAAADSDAAAEAGEETATSAAEGFEAGEENVTGAAEGSEAGEETATSAADCAAADAEAAAGAAEGAEADSDAAAEACEETATSAADCTAADAEAAAGAAEGAEADSGAAAEAGEETATSAADCAAAEAAEETATGAPEGAAADSDAAAEACEETATSAAEGFGAGEENVTGAAEGAAAEDGKETATGTAAGAPGANADGMVNIQATEIHCEGAGEMPLEQCKPVERTKGNATAVPKPRPKPKINISHAQAESNKQKRIIDAMKNGIEIESLSGAATPRAPEKLDLPAYMLENYGIDPGIPASEYRPVSGKKGRPQKIDVMSKGFDKLPLDVQNSQMKRYVNELLSALEGQKKIVELSELEINPYMERGDRRQLLVDAYHETVERLKVLGVKPVKGVLKRIFNFSSSELFYYDKVRPNLESNNLRMSQISDAVDEILTIYIREEGAIGPAQMQLQLSDEYGTNFSLYKVRRLMRLYGLDWLVLRSEKKYSSYLGTWALCGDLIRRDFYSDRPGIKIVTDITEFKCSNGKLYLCTFMDLWNKEILSWTISSSPSQIFVMKALNELMQYLPDDEDIIIHSDQGHHYQHESYLEFFEQRPKMHRSMSRKGNSPDNGAMESFFSILKNLLHGEMAFSQLTDVELRDKINQKIRNYNNIRALRWNSGVSPAARRAKWLNDNQWFIISGNGPAVVQTDDSTNAGSNVVASA